MVEYSIRMGIPYTTQQAMAIGSISGFLAACSFFNNENVTECVFDDTSLFASFQGTMQDDLFHHVEKSIERINSQYDMHIRIIRKCKYSSHTADERPCNNCPSNNKNSH